MGCGSSKTTTTLVRAIDSTKPPPTPKPRSTSANKKPSSADLDAIRKRKATRPESNTSAATVAAIQIRGESAKSHHSVDSGIGLASRSDSVKASNKVIASVGRPLTSAGVNSPMALLSRARPAEPADEKKILASLQQEGLLAEKSTATSKGGLVYEIPLDNLRPMTSRGPPRRLARLKLETRKQELELTKQTLKAKLDSADRRRREREQEKVARNRDKDTKNLDVKLSLIDFDHKKKMFKRCTVDEKLQEHAQKKAAHLDEIRSKLTARERRGSKQRTLLAVDPLELEVMSPKPPVINIDDLPVGGQHKFQF